MLKYVNTTCLMPKGSPVFSGRFVDPRCGPGSSLGRARGVALRGGKGRGGRTATELQQPLEPPKTMGFPMVSLKDLVGKKW